MYYTFGSTLEIKILEIVNGKVNELNCDNIKYDRGTNAGITGNRFRMLSFSGDNNNPVICPSHESYDPYQRISISYNKCYELKPDPSTSQNNNQWSFSTYPNTLTTKRRGAGLSYVDNVGWWITGGTDNGFSTEILKIDNNGELTSSTFESNLPGNFYDHCQVTLNTTHVLIFGGNGKPNQGSKRAWIFNWETKHWRQLNSMQIPKDNPVCSKIPNTNTIMVIDRSIGLTEIFDTNDESWTFGPVISTTNSIFSSFEMNGNLMVLSGTDNHNNRYFYKYDNATWTKIDGGITTSTEYFDVLPVRDDICMDSSFDLNSINH